MLNDFQISHQITKGQTVLMRVRGRLDAKSASQLLEQCAKVRAAGQNLVLNLADVSFIASSGIGALLALAEQFNDSPAQIRLAEPSAAVHSVLKLLNLDQFLTIDSSEGDALSALAA